MSFRLLYAEDEFTNRKIMEIQCKKRDISCHIVESGEEVLARDDLSDFDLIVLDQYMPGINGDKLAEEIENRGIKTPLVAITSDDTMVPHLLDKGFTEVLIKPLREKDYDLLFAGRGLLL